MIQKATLGPDIWEGVTYAKFLASTCHPALKKGSIYRIVDMDRWFLTVQTSDGTKKRLKQKFHPVL